MSYDLGNKHATHYACAICPFVGDEPTLHRLPHLTSNATRPHWTITNIIEDGQLEKLWGFLTIQQRRLIAKSLLARDGDKIESWISEWIEADHQQRGGNVLAPLSRVEGAP